MELELSEEINQNKVGKRHALPLSKIQGWTGLRGPGLGAGMDRCIYLRKDVYIQEPRRGV